jgi:hypothetical protein
VDHIARRDVLRHISVAGLAGLALVGPERAEARGGTCVATPDGPWVILRAEDLPDAEQAEFTSVLPELLAQVSASLPIDVEEPDVRAEAKWWGLVLILSDRATQQIRTEVGRGFMVTVLLSLIPVAGLAAGLIVKVLALVALLLNQVDRRRGIYITAPWITIAIPGAWIVTSR